MIIDGRKLAEEVYTDICSRVALLSHTPRLGIVTCAPNFETQKYLELKQKKARDVGIETEIITLSAEARTEDIINAITSLVSHTDGVVVQLPLPAGRQDFPDVDIDRVIYAVPHSHDVDALNPKTTRVYSPVVGAIQKILDVHVVNPKEKFVTIIGSGRLVGLPAAAWFQSVGAYVSVVNRDTTGITQYTKNADIIVCGAGVPNLITNDMVKEGVIVLDAGTSEEGGILKGDADPRIAEKASLFTPVPGGIGPLTIAVLLRNVVELALSKKPVV